MKNTLVLASIFLTLLFSSLLSKALQEQKEELYEETFLSEAPPKVKELIDFYRNENCDEGYSMWQVADEYGVDANMTV